MSWSPQQEAAIKAVRAWLKDPTQQVFYLAGFAGTGKTTLAKELAESVKGTVLFGAFTGKAALVLRRKGCGGASTIHSMIYALDEQQESWQPSFVLNHQSEVRKAELVVIDECSMVGEDLGRDLLSFGTKVLVLGDPAQLPPVKGEGFFTARQPNLMLTEVHRQALDNPIIAMSMQIREHRTPLDLGAYGESRVITRAEIDPDTVLGAGQVIVGLNRTRRQFNGRIRQLKGLDPAGPQAGDRLVCLRNNRAKKLLNGGLWTVEKVRGRKADGIRMIAQSDDHIEGKPTSIRVRPEFFTGDEADIPFEEKKGTDEFTYGYALTCHKSQGSQWDDLVVFDEAASFRDDAWRWRYTAITRAAERVTVVR